MLFVIGIINHNPKKSHLREKLLWQCGQNIWTIQSRRIRKILSRSYFWLVSFSHWGSARRKSPQSPDLLALMDFAVWGLDYSQPKTDLIFQTKKNIYECPSRPLQFLRRQALPQRGQVAQSRRRIWWRHTSSKRSLCSWWWRSHWRPSAAWDVGASLPAEAPRLPISGSGAPMIWRRGAPQNCSRHGFDG